MCNNNRTIPKPSFAMDEVAATTETRTLPQLCALLTKLYPIDSYGSRCSLFTVGLINGDITQDEYDMARQQYGRLWNYAGD
jgi:hypothetical protein